ncbi:MAG: hypothetical protein KAS32_03825 [Candidatus Peribacteraceae bacterium]|nr:hypothetical protein [Candidatus Peribacteraceae bacterium]
MQIDKKKLNSMAWYRLAKVVYFIVITLAVLFSILIGTSEFSVGTGLFVFVIVVAEVLRQIFFYIFTGEFLNKKYRQRLIKSLKVGGSILAIVLAIFFATKIVGTVRASMCESKLGSLGTFEEGVCDCIYGYTLENDVCISNDEICQRTLGEYAVSVYGKCNCKDGYSVIGGTCVETDDICTEQFGNAEGVFGEDKCVCKFGYEWNDAKDYCVKIYVPPPPPPPPKEKCSEHNGKAKYNAMSDKCDCTFDYVKIDGICQKPPYCGEHGRFDEGKIKCVCEYGYKEVNAECVLGNCTANSSYNPETNKCECWDGYLVRNGQCKSAISLCGSTGKYNTVTQDCIECGFGYELKGRDCVYKSFFDY